ncbi:MAG: YabP/YqfC family sporulation protein [Clostridia bacterium]|nr:YabP/YqfC family sporulation protein [Clostridia bacterium]
MKSDCKFIPPKGKQKIRFSGGEIFTSNSRIELFSNRELILEGCLGVTQFNDNYIKLSLKGGSLILYGRDFDISGFSEKTITVRGFIESIEFCLGDSGDV